MTSISKNPEKLKMRIPLLALSADFRLAIRIVTLFEANPTTEFKSN